MLRTQLESLGLDDMKSVIERFEESYKSMWTVNGHNLSMIFTGSRALEGKAKVCRVKLGTVKYNSENKYPPSRAYLAY